MNIFEKIQVAFTTGFSWWFLLDIILLSLLSYCVLAFLRRNYLMRLLKYLLAFCVVIAVLIGLTENTVVSAVIASMFASSLLVITAVLFKGEFRRGLFKLASPHKEADHYNTNFMCTDEELHHAVGELVRGCTTLAKNNVGALIVLQHDNMPQHIVDSGTRLGAVLSASLLECLFNTKAPLHDGAVVVEGNKIVAAGCFLPLTQSTTLSKELGTRHRAGIGITEVVDVLSIIVSEETGVISYVQNGTIERYCDADILSQVIEVFYGLTAVRDLYDKHN